MISHKFKSLAPTKLSSSSINTYKEALDVALSDPEIFNVAVTGSYGSGKSSLLKTYSSKALNKKFLNISLASFIEKGKEDSASDQQLESSILQQIFYRASPQKVPYSRFRRIVSYSNHDLTFWARGVTALGFAVLLLWEFKPTEFLFRWFTGYEDVLRAFALFLLFGGFYAIVRRIIPFLGRSLRKFSVGATGVELETSSIFNKHLDEIIYFFECNSYDVVVFEDIDRFPNTNVFTKLREINTLLNNSDQITHKLTFIYAVKDELFKDENRTKFFDLIIPIISVINSSNANEKLRERLALLPKKYRPKNNLVDDIAIYIQDMRMLNNIVNEYIIYCEQLYSGLNRNKLFSIVVYKNQNPEDFEKLLNGSGELYSVINNKKNWINELTEEVDSRIEVIETHKELLKQERFKSFKDLNREYIFALVKRHPYISGVELKGNKDYSLSDLDDESVFKEFREKPIKYIYRSSPHYSNEYVSLTFEELERDVDSNHSYQERYDLIQEAKYGFDDLNAEIQQLLRERNVIVNYSLKQVLNQFQDSNKINELSENKLLAFLVRSGYIDEHYHDYVSYFHEGSLTQKDYDFLQNIKSGIGGNFDMEVINIDNLITGSRLAVSYFSKPEIFNHNLIDHLITYDLKYNRQLKVLINQLKERKKPAVDFIISHSKSSKNFGGFLKKVCEHWTSFWADLIDNHELEYTPFLEAVLINCEEKAIETMMKDSSLGAAISNNIEVVLNLVRSDETFSKYLSLVQNLNIRFARLPFKTNNQVHDEFLNELYVEMNYRFSKENMITILKDYDLREVNEDTLDSQLLSEILFDETALVYLHVTENISEYVKNVFLKDSEHSKDTEETFIYILNSELSLDTKTRIIEKCDFQILKLSKLKEVEARALVFKENKLLLSWLNIETYYNDVLELNSQLIEALNASTAQIPERIDIDLFFDEDIANEINKLVIQSNDIEFKPFQDIVSEQFEYDGIDLGLETISIEKIKWLIKHQVLNLTLNNFNFIKSNFSTLIFLLIHVNYDDFIKSFDKFELEITEYDSLLSQIEEPEKSLKLINNLDNYEISLDKAISERILPLISDYKRMLSIKFLVEVFSFSRGLENKIRVILNQSSYLTTGQIQELVQLTKLKKLLMPKCKEYLPKNDMNDQFANLLVKRGIIGSVKEYKEDNRIRLIAHY